jgi:hypothetical protein
MGAIRELWLASIFGPFLIIMGLWMLLCKDRLAKVQASLKSTPACFNMLGVIQLLVGLAIVDTCRGCMLTPGLFIPGLLIAILGWVCVIRGIVFLFFPTFITKMMAEYPSWGRWLGVIRLIWGLALSFFAFQ